MSLKVTRTKYLIEVILIKKKSYTFKTVTITFTYIIPTTHK